MTTSRELKYINEMKIIYETVSILVRHFSFFDSFFLSLFFLYNKKKKDNNTKKKFIEDTYLPRLKLSMKARLYGWPWELLLQYRGKIEMWDSIGLDLSQKILPNASHSARIEPWLARSASKLVDQSADVSRVILHSFPEFLSEFRHYK